MTRDGKTQVPVQRGMTPDGGGAPDRTPSRLAGIVLGLVIACLALLFQPFPAAAAEEPPGALTLRWENDVLSSTDANYTAGFSVSHTRNSSGLLGWIWGDDGIPYSSYELAQLLFTPTDVDRIPPDPEDRPYAGILYLGVTTGQQTDNTLNALKLLVGVVGPSSLGEKGQKATHHVLGYSLPKGWGYQLKDEPLIDLIYERRHRYRLTGGGEGYGTELIQVGTAMVGNYLTKARAEVQLRLGYHLPDDFGETSIRGIGTLPAPENWRGETGIHLFAGGGADLVIQDITLDGNSSGSGPGVDKKHFVPSALAGLACRSGSLIGSFSYLFRGREFEGQGQGERYASLAVTYLFR